MIDFSDNYFIDTSLKTVNTHDFEIKTRSWLDIYKCKICGITLEHGEGTKNNYLIDADYEIVDLTCNEYMIYKVLL